MPLLEEAKARRSREIQKLMLAYLVAAIVIGGLGLAGFVMEAPMIAFLALAGAISLPMMGWHQFSQVLRVN